MLRVFIISFLFLFVWGAASADGPPPNICSILEPNSSESIEAGCCPLNQCEEGGSDKCVCSEQMENLNKSIVDITAAIEKLSVEKPKPSLCKDKKDIATHCRDLRAQERTAWWAGLAFLGLMGTLIQQVCANNILKKTSKNQLRAYINVTVKTSALKPRHPIALNQPIEVIIESKNVGLTPANKVRINSGYTVHPTSETEPDLVLFSTSKSLGSLAPTDKRTRSTSIEGEHALESPDLRDRLTFQTETLWVHGIITYEDIYGDSHETAFRCTLTGPEVDGRGLSIHSEGNKMT